MKTLLLAVRAWSLASSVAAVLCLSPVLANADQFGCFTYSSDGSAVTITRLDPSCVEPDVTVPDIIENLPVTAIMAGAFSRCTNIVSVTLPDGLLTLGSFAFNGCSHLTVTTISRTVTNIERIAFYACSSLTAINVDPLNPSYTSEEGVLFNHQKDVLIAYPGGKPGSYAIPNTVADIEEYAFYSSALTNVSFPQSVTNIPSRAFGYCSNLTGVTIGENVTAISSNAFAWCTSLPAVSIPSKVRTIGFFSFGFCTNLTNVAIAKGATAIGEAAFEACLRLPSIELPDSVASIGDQAFKGCFSLTNIILGNSVTNIGSEALASCTSLPSITIPRSMTIMPDQMLAFCVSLTNVAIASSVTSIGESTCHFCTGLQTVSIPRSVTNIDSNAFSYCTNLTAVYFEGDAPVPGGLGSFYGLEQATVYYLPGTTGWGLGFDFLFTAPWPLASPAILSFGSSFGMVTNSFNFRTSWATNATVIVDGCTNLLSPVWSPLATNTLAMGIDPLTDGWFDFSDPDWTNHCVRFYRVRSL